MGKLVTKTWNHKIFVSWQKARTCGFKRFISLNKFNKVSCLRRRGVPGQQSPLNRRDISSLVAVVFELACL